MTTLVVDASVAAKWFLPAAGETLTQQALQLLKRYAAGELRFLVPDLFWVEFANIMWKAVRQRRWPQASAEVAVRAMRDRNFPSVSSLTLLEDAFAIASTFDRTVYDGIYVALALTSKTELITADERLANALAAHLPVKWLGSF
ncbi:MAG TPA: type II toxin-antitoxin system VapC family toxin [Terriglobales bacterium]|nr:type II toxin-antitoxin system VapC family toxin [Terriglobales bacterium]